MRYGMKWERKRAIIHSTSGGNLIKNICSFRQQFFDKPDGRVFESKIFDAGFLALCVFAPLMHVGQRTYE